MRTTSDALTVVVLTGVVGIPGEKDCMLLHVHGVNERDGASSSVSLVLLTYDTSLPLSPETENPYGLLVFCQELQQV